MRFQSHLVLTLAIATISVATPILFGQSFDERFEIWPTDLKISGTIIAGGGFDLPEEAKSIFLKAASKENAQAVVLHFENKSESAQVKPNGTEIPESDNVTVFTLDADQPRLSQETIAALNSANAAWITSDVRFNKRQSPLLDQLLTAATEVIAREGLVCFNSPFAESLGRLKQDTIAGLTATTAGANLIPDTAILPVYDDADRNVLLSVLAANPKTVGIGIEKGSAIILRHRKIRVLGEGNATFCLMANEHLPLRVQHVKKPESRRANPYETIIDLTAWRRDAIERTLPRFPAEKPPEPFIENGTLLIVGGGGMPTGLMDKMVELAGGKDAKLVYIPCSESDDVTGPQRMVETWKKMGVASATFIHTKDRTKANLDEGFLAPLSDATGIWFGGGRQWNFSDSYYGTKAHRMMKEVLQRGGVIGGSSAGASIQARYMCRANPVANFDIMAPGYERGLGFIGGVAIDQHFTQRGRQKDMTQLVNRYPQLLGIGIDEATAIIVSKSRAEVVGKGKVHFYDRNQPVVPGKDDFVAVSDDQVYDLVQRKVITTELSAEESRD